MLWQKLVYRSWRVNLHSLRCACIHYDFGKITESFSAATSSTPLELASFL
ncbi:hypothetical protein [uncultured Helicobacter sp.]